MDANLVQIVSEVLKQWALFSLLVGVLYWMYTNDKSRNEAHENQMRELQATFKWAIDEIVSSFKESTDKLDVQHQEIRQRLDRIEADIRQR